MRADKRYLYGAIEYYRNNPIDFICHWMDTYDPRNAGKETPARMPFVLFEKQKELIRFLRALIEGEEDGLIEKSRDMGASFVSAAFSIWLWRFVDGAAIGWGSRKAELVDNLGDPKSIFEKIRIMIRYLPRIFYPAGFDPSKHMTFMKIINPETGATITGEGGDNIGRGGRTLLYFKDESAHYERAESIQAALDDNTRVQVDISSVCGMGTVFHRRREAGEEWQDGQKVHEGVTNVFIMDWRDHPHKDQAWYDKRKKKAEDQGLLHLFAQEVDRDYGASVEGVIIPAAWIESAVDAHIKLGFDDSGGWMAGLDVADEGRDRNAFAARKGVILKEACFWSDRDTTVTAQKAADMCRGKGNIEVQYDCIGVGAGVKGEANRLVDEGIMPRGVTFVPWDAGSAPRDKEEHVIPDDTETPLNGDFYENMKAQGWWNLRMRFEKTHKAVTQGAIYPVDDMISLCSNMPILQTLKKELAQPTSCKSARLKLKVDKMPEGARSPNVADAVMQAFFPAEIDTYTLDYIL